MQRREFITLLGGAAAAWPRAAGAQQPAMPVVGWLSDRTAAADALLMPAFYKAFAAQGFVVGRNVRIEYRNADAQVDRFPALAADLVRSRAAVIVAASGATLGTRALQALNTTIPIVGVYAGDPVRQGFVPNINRPGGNITGVIPFQSLVAGKRLGLLRDLLPQATTIAVLTNPTTGINAKQQTEEVQDAAGILGLQTRILSASTESELAAAFVSLAQMRPDALFFTISPLFFTYSESIVAAATRLALPTSHYRREFVLAGGLMSYASTTDEIYRVLGEYAGRILKGEKAGDLPIQQPTKLELVLNLKTAKALGITVPTSMLLLADEVIE